MSNVKELAKRGAASVAVAALTLVNLPYKTFAVSSDVESIASSGGSSPQSTAQNGFNKVQEQVGAGGNDLLSMVGTILNIVYGVIGIIAVVMVILGGISYATSQGDPGKVKKGKDTILYGIIGLVIVLLAFPITSFILSNLS